MLTKANVVSYLKSLSIETYVLIVLPVLITFTMFAYGLSEFSFRTLTFYFFAGGPFLKIVVIFMYVYFFAKIVFVLFEYLIFKKGTIRDAFAEMVMLLKNQMYFGIVLAAGFLLSDFLLNALSDYTSRERITWSTALITNLDYLIFRQDVSFWLVDFVNHNGGAVLSWILVHAYTVMSGIIPIFVLMVFIFNKTLAKKFITFFFVIQFISVPMWFFMPTMNPISRYILNILDVEPPARIANALDRYHPDPVLNSFQQDIVLKGYEKHKDYLNLTAFPSMHAAWSFGILIFAFLLWRPLNIVLVPWFLLEMIGAVYTGEHYVVDLFLGVGVAVVAYFVVEALAYIEKKYYIGKGSFLIIDSIQSDAKVFFRSTKLVLETAAGQWNDLRRKKG